jgi:alkylhydroperoxidase family enzyme
VRRSQRETRVASVGDEPLDPRVAVVFERFAREGRAPIALYRALANAPDLLEPYSALAQALRHRASTSRELRELVVLRVAHLTGSEYEWSHHRKMAEQEGIAPEKLRTLGRGRESDAFGDAERAALRLADEVHDVAVSDETVAELSGHFAPGEVVELVMLASVYQAVARMIQGLGVQVEEEYAPYRGPP